MELIIDNFFEIDSIQLVKNINNERYGVIFIFAISPPTKILIRSIKDIDNVSSK